MPIRSDPRFVGRAWITPDRPVVAGEWGTWTFTYEVGAYGYDERARLKIASRFASDWGRPQFSDPAGANYTTVRLESRCPTAVASVTRGPVRITGRVAGTGPLERVDVFRGLECVATLSPYTAAAFQGSARYRIAWAGSRVRGRDRLTTWDGHLELSAGRILAAEAWAMENPEKGIVRREARRIDWVSNTTGDDDGIDLTLDAPPETVVRFRSPVIDLDVRLHELADGVTRTFPAGGVDLRVFMRRLPVRGFSRDLPLDVTDPAPPARRCHAYWIRVTQEDGAQAWTSPVYLQA
jgi:hypothetical protein